MNNLIKTVPEEIWLYIFKHINIQSWYNLSKTCKKFYRICNDKEVCKIFWYNNSIKLYKNIVSKKDDSITYLLVNRAGIYQEHCNRDCYHCRHYTSPCDKHTYIVK